MEQLTLWASGVREPRSAGFSPRGVDAGHLGRWLTVQLERPVSLVITNNRSTMLSCRERGEKLQLRLHRIFLDAPQQVHEALVAYLGHDDVHAGRILDAFIAAQPPDEVRRPQPVRPQGHCHDLAAILDELNHTYFHGAVSAQITWSSPGTRRRRRSIQLGCYLRDEALIRIHPCLDQAFVPRTYVAWVVFHEMLHEVFGVERRRAVHPPEFIALEESFPDYRICRRWETENLDRLLRYRPRHSVRR